MGRLCTVCFSLKLMVELILYILASCNFVMNMDVGPVLVLTFLLIYPWTVNSNQLTFINHPPFFFLLQKCL